jgi:hypothetical protein
MMMTCLNWKGEGFIQGEINPGNTIIVRVLRNQNYWKGSAWQINQPAFLLGAGWKNKATQVKVDSNVEKYEHRGQEDPRERESN